MKVILSGVYRGVEQSVARRAHNPKAVGSSPAPATKFAALACEMCRGCFFIVISMMKTSKKCFEILKFAAAT